MASVVVPGGVAIAGRLNQGSSAIKPLSGVTKSLAGAGSSVLAGVKGLANGVKDAFKGAGAGAVTVAEKVKSALVWAKDRLGAGGVQSVADKIRRGELSLEEINALPTAVREQLRGIDRGDGRDIFGKYTTSDKISANKEALGLQEVGLDLGVDVLPDQIVVRLEAGGQGRRYDGLIHVKGNQYIGVEIKSGGAHREYMRPGNVQRQFDGLVSQSNPAKGILNGQPVEIVQVIDHRVP
ncbi:hypothetical protein G7067_06880 [Leucobacter insecticola]|uniref:Uncharacterized protein n=1 Tax=Leucobacter insecticola TaxID=2714934 RepID=A0A6G8FIP8_9MICO|nr:hypothetical protein [Leucobacter insecticola]QIM16208.1 hypothetical protein G7067_06880 [Leucobacter insecticola]